MTGARGRGGLSILLPGLLVAATGVGAGDLVTAALAGSETGLALLWAAVVGSVLKFALNEGLTRWQLATGRSLLEGWITHLGRGLGLLFGAYLLLWSFCVGGALISACAVAGDAWLRIGDAQTSRLLWGTAHSLLGLALARRRGLASFERVMAATVLLMTVCVLVSAARLAPPPGELLAGLVPSVPSGGGLWALGVLGGVGGTVTLLSYGYWIAAHERKDLSALRHCRLDLAASYGLTALFGVAMIVIGARIPVQGQGAGVAVALGDAIATTLGPAGSTLFLLGFHAAVFSSLLGVWQGVPYLFADLWRVMSRAESAESAEPAPLHQSRPYRGFQLALALVPLPLLTVSFRTVQQAYAAGGALFMPFLAGTLLLLTNRKDWIGTRGKSGLVSNTLLLATLAFFAWQGWLALG